MTLPIPNVDPPIAHPDVLQVMEHLATHRLHLAIVLVGIHHVPAPVVLDLTWPQVHPKAREIRVPGLTVHLDTQTVQLLHWHACRQRLDRRRAGPAWRHSLRVFVDQAGRPYTEANADEAVTIAAATAGLPPFTFEELRGSDCAPARGHRLQNARTSMAAGFDGRTVASTSIEEAATLGWLNTE